MAREHLTAFRKLARERLAEPLRAGDNLDADRLYQAVTELCRVAQAGGASALPLKDLAAVLFDITLHMQSVGRAGAKRGAL